MKIYLEKVRLNRSGYDRHGEYWGVGSRLYRYAYAGDGQWHYIRANDRQSAKEVVKAHMTPEAAPAAEFFR